MSQQKKADGAKQLVEELYPKTTLPKCNKHCNLTAMLVPLLLENAQVFLYVKI